MEFRCKCVLLLVCCGLSAVLATTPGSLTHTADMSLMQFMTRSRDWSQQNPQRSLACFDYYLPLLNAVSEQYEKSYAACQAKASDARCAVDNSTQAEREEIAVSAQDACNLLSSCNQYSSALSYFECYADAGSQDAKTMYAISANASEILAVVREQYRLIESDEYRCTNASERAYVQDTAATYEQLQSCLQGKTPVPSTTTTTPSALITTTATNSTASAEDLAAAASSKPKRVRRQLTADEAAPSTATEETPSIAIFEL